MDVTNNAMYMLQKSLDYTWQKMGVISENISNVNTPGYKAKYVSFEDELKRNMAGAKSAADIRNAVDKTRIRVHTSNDEALKLDGNNVNLDAEYVEEARTQIQYEYLIKQINDQFTRLQTVIEGR